MTVHSGQDEMPAIQSEWFSAAGAVEGAGSRVLVLGCAPLPFENQKLNLAPGLRSWQFARGIAHGGHRVCLVGMRIPGTYSDGEPPIARIERGGVDAYTVDEELFRRSGLLDEVVARFSPDAVVGASSSAPAVRAVEVAGDLPLWIDLFGDPMAEAQARLGFDRDADPVPYREALAILLERGDVFSVVSERQRRAALGQLGLSGRLNEKTRGTELVHAIPCCVVEPDDTGAAGDRAGVGPPEFDDDDVVVLWSGGFNTWCDADTLLEGLELAMEDNDAIRLAVTGGAIRGHDDLSYPRFVEDARRSRFADRIVVKGPLDRREAARYRRRADLGVVTEKTLVERELGSSGRVLGWLSSGLPVVLTDQSELGATLAAEGLAATYRVGDPRDLARLILEVAADLPAAKAAAERARTIACERWSIERTTRELRSWVGRCRRSPDADDDNPLALTDLGGGALLRAERARSEALRLEVNGLRNDLDTARAELGEIHHSRMWKTWMAYYRILGFFGLGPNRRRS